MQFGVPKFNSLLNFFTRAVNPVDTAIATTGRVPKMFYAGKAVGGFVMFCAFPMITLTIWFAKTIIGAFVGGSFDYYYMLPSMHTYWASVNILVTNIATELGILSPMFLEDKDSASKIGIPVGVDKQDMLIMSKYFPDIISAKTGYIDIYAVSQRMQRIANKQAKYEYDHWSKQKNYDLTGYLQKNDEVTKGIRTPGEHNFWNKVDNFLTFEGFLERMTGIVKEFWDGTTPTHKDNSPKNNPMFAVENDDKEVFLNGVEDKLTSGTGASEEDRRKEILMNTTDNSYNISTETASYLDKLSAAFDSVNRDGGVYAVFNVDYQGSVSESISNSVSEVPTAGALKQVGQAGRDVKFSLAGGNIFGDVQKAITDGTLNFLKGALDGATFGLSNVISTLLGGGYVDIPKKWDDSDISLPTITYNMSLVSPYGNPISQLQNIYIPLCMILAGSLPLKAGEHSYVSPFLCSIFNKGVQEIKLGMITSVSITRGTTNLGFSRQKKALAYDVSFTVTDFSNIMTAPINSSIFDTLFNVQIDDESKIGRYLATLASRDLFTAKYSKPKIKIALSRSMMYFEQAISPNAWADLLGNKFTRPIVGLFANEKRITTISQNNGNNYF